MALNRNLTLNLFGLLTEHGQGIKLMMKSKIKRSSFGSLDLLTNLSLH
jgi:hypothetical protein